MSGHTPGPWRVSYDDGMSADIVGEHQRVAITYATKNQAANARLIAAAPEMLEALKAIVWEATSEKRDLALRAIAKAEGRDL